MLLELLISKYKIENNHRVNWHEWEVKSENSLEKKTIAHPYHFKGSIPFNFPGFNFSKNKKGVLEIQFGDQT